MYGFATVPTNAAYYRLNAPRVGTTNIQIESKEYSDYEQYKGNTYSVSWETEAGAVYGGMLDVAKGKLTVRPYYASYNGEALVGPWVSSMDVYTEGATPTVGAQVVDMGGTQQTYQLTPTEVKTLLGANNIWADTGNVSVTYRADPTRYADKRAAATLTAAAQMLSNVETDMTATRAYAVNDFLSVNGQLYRVTAAIANGEEITPGTNVTETTIGAQITALLNA